VLESQPHDNIHGAVGGFMSEFLSPVDPLFFMHHSNIDRLWDVWTRKQEKLGLPTLPTGPDLATWSNEPFLFYVGPAGTPVTQGKAGDYGTIGDFNYAYQPGSGEQFVPAGALPQEFANRTFTSALSREVLDFHEPTVGSASVPEALAHAAAAKGGPQLVARIALSLPANRRGLRFHVLVNPPKDVSFNDPSFAATITPFGSHSHGHMSGPVTFEVPLTNAVRKLHAAGLWRANEPIRVQVVPDTLGVTLTPFQVPVKSISIRTL
jgi:tyrosinase